MLKRFRELGGKIVRCCAPYWNAAAVDAVDWAVNCKAKHIIWRSWAVFVLLSGCALVSEPAAPLAAARQAIEDAERAGAAELAPAELAAAIDRLARAEARARQRHYDEAVFLAEQAEADARLAAVRSRATATEAAQGRQRPPSGRPSP